VPPAASRQPINFFLSEVVEQRTHKRLRRDEIIVKPKSNNKTPAGQNQGREL
jgi:hypothetical protein